MKHSTLWRLVIVALLALLALAPLAQPTGAQETPLTTTASISQDSLTGYSIKVDLTGPARARIDVFLTVPSVSHPTYAFVEYRGATDGGGACWWDTGMVRCYGSTDNDGVAHIDYTFVADIGGPTPHDLFVCQGSACEHIELYLPMPWLRHSYLPVTQKGGTDVGTTER